MTNNQRKIVMTSSQTERIDLSVERKMTEEQEIEGIRTDLRAEEQRSKINLLESVCQIMIIKLLNTNQYKSFELKKDPLILKKTPNKTETEEVVINKLTEINSTKNILSEWLTDWDLLVIRSNEIYKNALQRKNEMEKSEGVKGKYGNYAITAQLIIGGAYNGYEITEWLLSNGWDKALEISTIGSCLMEQDSTISWVEKMLGISFQKKSLKKIIQTDSLAGSREGMEIKNQLILKMAKKIDMNPETLLMLKDTLCEDFMDFMSKTKKQTESYAYDVIISEMEISPITKEERVNAIEDEKKLYKYLSSKGDISNKTVEDCLK